MIIFEGYIYPENEEIMYLDYFKDYFDSVFVCFNPFFKMSDEYIATEKYPSKKEIDQFGNIVYSKKIGL